MNAFREFSDAIRALDQQGCTCLSLVPQTGCSSCHGQVALFDFGPRSALSRRWAIRYEGANGAAEYGPDCKSPFCAVLTVLPWEGRQVTALMLDGRAFKLTPMSGAQLCLRLREKAQAALEAFEAASSPAET
ncbi:hypothetical protein [Lysobacter capsici]|uniref:hypothetical protein n=1 Tax=Lysobacter capsici TaxID=435897 RepID=UPI001C005DB0|nr:hypothetical protein [Lysobacter capsici]QWF18678.1 hypothetical protein KME82_08035 [Lysobacter capsici]